MGRRSLQAGMGNEESGRCILEDHDSHDLVLEKTKSTNYPTIPGFSRPTCNSMRPPLGMCIQSPTESEGSLLLHQAQPFAEIAATLELSPTSLHCSGHGCVCWGDLTITSEVPYLVVRNFHHPDCCATV